jgi:hypothetical protein
MSSTVFNPSNRFMPDAWRRFERVNKLEHFDFLLLADPEFAGLVGQAKNQLKARDGMGAIVTLRKAEKVYEAVEW